MLDRAVRDVMEAYGCWDAGDRVPYAIEVSRSPEHGDFACNAALVWARRARRSPREIATRLVEAIGDAGGLVQRTEVAGPGFVNLWLARARWHGVLTRILETGAEFGRSDVGKGERVQVEFVSANPTGPLTLGHGRNAVLGDCIARLLEATGCHVTREYYFNDGGRQMRLLGESVKARYLELLGLAAPPPAGALADPDAAWPPEIDGLPVAFPRDGYQGDYIREIARSLLDARGRELVGEDPEGPFKTAAEQSVFAEIRRALDALGIRFDVYSNELMLYQQGKIDEVLKDLRALDLAYEADGATWLRAQALGLARDRVIVKSSGEPTYILPDIAYHREKFRRDFERVIDVQGADHIDTFPFVRAAVAALGHDPSRIEYVIHQFVTLSSGGASVKQSTRRATYVTVDELLEEVGPDVFRFFMIQRKPEAHLDFDLDLAKEQDWTKNPAYYLQYAHARTHGIERKARERGRAMPQPGAIDASRLDLPEELELIKRLGQFPDVVARAAESREPHHVAYYLQEIAGLWNPYVQDGVRHRVLSDDEALTDARLGLALGVRVVLANGLRLLGVHAPERM
ncbi:MAG: arginine--tRNA ligase [Deltaproteobacteria bacterium]|nr:MAG: arginine--tRNA ligase [Deltaproteobacteria bacterium]